MANTKRRRNTVENLEQWRPTPCVFVGTVDGLTLAICKRLALSDHALIASRRDTALTDARNYDASIAVTVKKHTGQRDALRNSTVTIAKNATVLRTALYGLAPVVRAVTAHSTALCGLAPIVRAVTAHSTALCGLAPIVKVLTAQSVALCSLAPYAANTTIAATTVHNDHAHNVAVVTDETSAHSALALFVRRDTTVVNVLKHGAKGASAIIAKTAVFVQRSAVVETATSWRTALSFVICVNAVMRDNNNVLMRCVKLKEVLQRWSNYNHLKKHNHHNNSGNHNHNNHNNNPKNHTKMNNNHNNLPIHQDN
ncbi:hypothetical protein QOT17_008392 [Balamuthia mandrillaris]